MTNNKKTKERIKALEEKIMWGWFSKVLPSILNVDEDDDIGDAIKVTYATYKGTLSWFFEKDCNELLFELDKDGTFMVKMSDVCGNSSEGNINKQRNVDDLENIKSVVYMLCTIFSTGDWHSFLSFVPKVADTDDLRDSILYYDEINNI